MKRTPEARPRFKRVIKKESYSSVFLIKLSDAQNVADCGHKAASLSKMFNAKFNVPGGFVIPTKAYQNAVLNESSISTNFEDIRENLLKCELPSDLERAILDKCAEGKWAVRSSSTIEDSLSLSFAGQMDTFLNVSGDEILTAVRKVWASNFSERSLTYRTRARLDSDWPSMAVIIQRMGAVEKGGVLFTVNPSDLNDESMVISVADGEIPDVVSGKACDTYYVARGSGYTLKSSEKATLLNDAELKELAKLGDRIERHFTRAMDIEWGSKNGVITILQARPITTIINQRTTVWSNANVGESLPGVATPMTWSIIDAFSHRGFKSAFGTLGLDIPVDANLADSFRGRIYLNLTEFVDIAKGIPFLSAEALHDMAGGGGLSDVLENAKPGDHRLFWQRFPKTVLRIAKNQISTPIFAATTRKSDTLYIENFFNTDLSRLQHDVLKSKKETLDVFFDKTGELLLKTSSNFILSVAIIREAMRLAGKAHYVRSASDLLDGLHIESSEVGTDLVDLSRLVRQSLRLRTIFETHSPADIPKMLRKENSNTYVAAFNREFNTFLKKHGNRAVREAELATPRWREDPAFPLSIIKGHVLSPSLGNANPSEFDETMFESFSPTVKKLYQGLFTWSRFNAQSREKLRAKVVQILGMYRVMALECGRRMVRSGLLRNATDVFFLSYKEVGQWLEEPTKTQSFRLAVITRQAQFLAFQRADAPPNVFKFDGRRLLTDEKDEELGEVASTFKGLAASRGRVTGIARVVKDPTKLVTLSPGEILVVPYADIAFTPLFLSARAIVIELGGPLSHAAIVAREYGIPTVVSVENATKRIEDGMLITVDGDNGEVHLSK